MLRGAIAITITTLLSTTALAAGNRAPSLVYDPMLGLSLASVRLEPLPEAVRALCVQIADNDNWRARQWIFASARHATSTYYLVGGYFERRRPRRGQGRYLQPDDGGVFRVTGSDCAGDPARATFAVRDPAQIPREVLQQLAMDGAARLVRALGSEARLRAEIAQQAIAFEQLSPELQAAFKPYFEGAD